MVREDTNHGTISFKLLTAYNLVQAGMDKPQFSVYWLFPWHQRNSEQKKEDDNGLSNRDRGERENAELRGGSESANLTRFTKLPNC